MKRQSKAGRAKRQSEKRVTTLPASVALIAHQGQTQNHQRVSSFGGKSSPTAEMSPRPEEMSPRHDTRHRAHDTHPLADDRHELADGGEVSRRRGI